MKLIYLILFLGSLFLAGCQKKEEESIDFDALLNREETEAPEWSLPQKVTLEEDSLPNETLFYEDSEKEIVLFEKDSYGEGLR